MRSMTRKSLLAVAIATLGAVPIVAAADSYKEGQAQQQMHSQMGTSGRLQTMTPSQLRGTEVIGTNGEQIGAVKKVVQSRQDKNIHAVISSGGVMGVGDREFTVPLDRMRYEGGKLRLSATADELRSSPAYRDEQYVEVRPMDQPISEFSAFETVPDRAAPRREMRSGARGWDSGSTGAATGANSFYPESQQFTP